MAEIINIVDPRVLAIPIIESHEPLIDLKNQTELSYGPPPETPLTKNDYTKLRETVFKKICAAQKKLPTGWRFRVYEGFRSLAVQKLLFDHQWGKFIQANPNASKEKAFYEVTRLVSPITNLDGSVNVPPHNTGAAVDIEIIDETGKLIDMGMTAADWITVSAALCQTSCTDLPKKIQDNRHILLSVMEAEGFANYPTEWWHFSYGDRYWAYVKKQSHAIYDSVG